MGVAFREFAEVYGFKRAFIISDANLYRSGAIDSVEKLMRKKESELLNSSLSMKFLHLKMYAAVCLRCWNISLILSSVSAAVPL